MHFTTATSTAALLASALSLTSASPLTSRSTSTSFKLIYRPISGNTLPIPLKALAHGTWAVAGSSSRLILSPDSPSTTLTFYQYALDGSSAIATSSTGVVITPGGSATVPSSNVLQLVSNRATKDVVVGKTPEGVPALEYGQGRFQACLAGDEIVLRYVQEGQRLLEGCMESVLAVRCMGEGIGGDLGENVEVECNMTPF
ncbi:hypothetical protein DE146DRAFT_634237 [Phaeosphaeria sp. MPI-PUGE-AT-0046c]|nr:hypothetical protein DE146DRAFT_634237 [Phaeosphaeria sp. MPI-PUGE-AT-0046c]